MSSGAEAAAATTAGAPSVSALREYTPTAVALFYLITALSPGAGFLVLFMVPVMLIWLARMAWLARYRPARRRAQRIKLSLVAAAITAVVLLHLHYQADRRQQADKIAQDLVAFQATHGAYPKDLADIGLDAKALQREKRIFYYSENAGHSLFYSSTFILFDTYGYDFDHRSWIFHPD